MTTQRLILWITNSLLAVASCILFYLSGHWILSIVFGFIFLFDVSMVFEHISLLKDGK